MISGTGTEESPIWIVGKSGDMPVFRRDVGIFGSYILAEYMEWDFDARLYIGDGDHISVRHCKMTGTGVESRGGVLSIGGSATKKASHVVIYGNEISFYGNHAVAAGENDAHAIKPGRYCENVWVLENHTHHNGGDSIQIGGNPYSDAEEPQYIYVGKNTFHDDHENAVDIKESKHVVISSNIMHSYEETSSSSGEVAVVHYNPVDIWFINNVVHGGTVGIKSTGVVDLYVVGNVIYNNHGTTQAETKNAAVRAYGGGAITIVNNTMYDNDTGVELYNVSPVNLANNIISEVNGALYYVTATGNVSGTMSHTIFHQTSGSPSIYWSSSAQAPDSFTGSSLTNPSLVDPALGNFNLTPSSPAQDAGMAHPVYNTFKGRFGISLAQDAAGTVRPASSAWDIGAYEVPAAAQTPVPPNPPQNLRVVD
jgi:hypothetical protein